MKRQFSLPDLLQQQIRTAVAGFGWDLDRDSKKIAESILRLSDYFIANPQRPTPWKENWAQLAYLSYFLPLNFLRNQAVVDEGQRLGFFDDLENAVDFGAGPGTAGMALEDTIPASHVLLVEQASEARALNEKYFQQFSSYASSPRSLPPQSLGVFSFSFTELSALPPWAFECEALMILEPSTQDDSRRLQALREPLFEKGFFVWAPCVHQLGCPLLLHSKKDWCHDRIFFDAPEWYLKIENHLPMKNRTLTYSYLLLRKEEPPPLPQTGRLVGDQLEEKGKSRQMFCRNDQREFLAWLHRQGPVPEHHRGELFELPENHQEVSNEIRLEAISK